MIYTTLSRIRAHSPYSKGWEKLLRHLGKTQADDKPLPLLTVLESNGLDDALWCLRAEPQHSAIWRLYAVRCARRVQHLMADPRSLNALDVAERHARGEATDGELAAARYAAQAAAWAVDLDSAGGSASCSASSAAWGTARNEAGDAAWYAAWASASWASACEEAEDSAWDAALYAARSEQAADLRIVLEHYNAMPGEQITGWRDISLSESCRLEEQS